MPGAAGRSFKGGGGTDPGGAIALVLRPATADIALAKDAELPAGQLTIRVER